MSFLGGSGSNESACNAGDLGSICGSERSPGEGNGNPLWYSCLGNPMDQGAWWATVHGVARVRHDLATDTTYYYRWGTMLVAQIVKSLPEMQETQVRAPGREDPDPRSLGEGNGNPLQCSCLGNPTDREAWWATVHGAPKSRTQPSNWHLQMRNRQSSREMQSGK